MLLQMGIWLNPCFNYYETIWDFLFHLMEKINLEKINIAVVICSLWLHDYNSLLLHCNFKDWTPNLGEFYWTALIFSVVGSLHVFSIDWIVFKVAVRVAQTY